MRVLVIGSGAREHALVARLAADRDVGELVVRARKSRHRRGSRAPSRSTSPTSTRSLALADREQIDLTVVGPELPLSLGVADRFAADGRLLFGPTAAAARLESSKAFAKAFMARHGVPTARFRTCESLDEALARRPRRASSGCRSCSRPTVSPPARASSSPTIAPTAEAAIVAAMSERRFGAAGDRLVIEECLTGPGGVVLRRLRRRARAADRHRPGSQAHLRRRPRTEHRRHGRVRAEPAGRRRARGARHARDRRAGDRRAWRPKGIRFADFSTSA